MNLVKFVPSRDTPLEIIVPANLCCELLDSNGSRWCEVFVPPHSIMNVHKPWSTIVVEPEHVFFIPNESYNMFWINAGAKLNLYYKTETADNVRTISGSESEYAEGVLARFLQYEAYLNNRISSGKDCILQEIYADYKQSGLTMMAFVKSLQRKV